MSEHLITLKFGGICRSCRAKLAPGSLAYYDGSRETSRKIECEPCRTSRVMSGVIPASDYDTVYAETEDSKMHYRCGICGNMGHNARTCPAKGTPHFSHTDTPTPRYDAPTPEPTEYVFKSKVWNEIETLMPHSRLILLYGIPGTGKTTSCNKMAINDRPVFNVTLTEETPAAELRGHFIPKGDEWFFHFGPAMQAFRDGGVLILNEIDKASGDALTFCHALCDDPGIAAITLPTGETVYPSPNFCVRATMNGVPEDLPEALQSRFAIKKDVPEPHPNAIASLPNHLRKACVDSIQAEDNRTVTFREWFAFADLTPKVGEKIAASAVFGNRANEILRAIALAGTR